MTETVYTIGYTARKPEELQRILAELGADLFDIRYSPASRNVEYSRKRLTERLGPAYTHVRALGNANYKGGGPIQIVDFSAGLAAIRANEKPVVLMCACKDYQSCHRRTVSNLLAIHGITTQEIPLAAARPNGADDSQLSLF